MGAVFRPRGGPVPAGDYTLGSRVSACVRPVNLAFASDQSSAKGSRRMVACHADATHERCVMQVLGSLIKLGTVHSALPVPWWHRSPLGLLHGTRVYVALVKSAKRPVGDLIVSVLDPARWGQMVRVDFEKADEPGVLASAFASAKPLNIAIAETVTVETGDKHQGSLVCEPVDQEAVVDIDAMRSRFETSGFTSNVRIEPFLRSLPPILWQAVTVLDHGWARDIDWSD